MLLSKLELLEKLLYGDDGLLLLLRMGDGLNNEKFEEVCLILKELAIEWRERDHIPKRAALLLFELYPAMSSGNRFYKEKELEKIEDAADIIYDLILDCIGN